MSVALITGASRGLGRALTTALADRGWSLVVDARGEHDLATSPTRTTAPTSPQPSPASAGSTF
jgi:NAD(P)-dependent dehydrogenase (short-subunit alcohol dehydrogenase family)